MIPTSHYSSNIVVDVFNKLYDFPFHVDWRFNFEFLVDCVGYTHLHAPRGLLHHSCLRESEAFWEVVELSLHELLC